MEGEKGKRIIPKWGRIKKRISKIFKRTAAIEKKRKKKKGKEEFDKFGNYSTIDGK